MFVRAGFIPRSVLCVSPYVLVICWDVPETFVCNELESTTGCSRSGIGEGVDNAVRPPHICAMYAAQSTKLFLPQMREEFLESLVAFDPFILERFEATRTVKNTLQGL